MAKKPQNRLEKRREVEAAEALEQDVDDVDDVDSDDDETPRKKKKAAKKKAAPRAKRTKTKAVIRKRIVWGVFSSSMKEEGRFPYADREAAEQKMEMLVQKNKRTYFIQAIKEPIAEPPPVAATE